LFILLNYHYLLNTIPEHIDALVSLS